MKRLLLIIAFIIFGFATDYLQAQDIIVKKDGTILNVYNLEESGNSFFFTLEPSIDAAIQKINKEDVFSVKKSEETTSTQIKMNATNNHIIKQRDIVTAEISSEIMIVKGRKRFSAKTPDGQELLYAILSENEHTVTVIGRVGKDTKYRIPENIKLGEELYVVTEIGKRAFCNENIEDIMFPVTLKKIGIAAFALSGLKRIVLPEGLEEIERDAFYSVNKRNIIYEIYLPSSLKEMGSDCFLYCGKALSPNGYCKAYFSNIPSFVTSGNSEDFGIDDSAVEDFQRRKKQ